MKLISGSAICFILSRCSLVANPQSPAVIAGDASFEIRSPEVLEVIAADRSIIEWTDFSIEVGETTRFIQQHENASVLNRVLSSSPSQLMGRLESNGQIILFNPNGILVGKNAQIDTGSFIASTLDLNRDVFENSGSLLFATGGKGRILNEGFIQTRSGDAFLIGSSVEQNGAIRAAKMVGAIAAEQVEINFGTLSIGTLSNDVSVGGSILSPGGEIYVFGERIQIQEGALLDVSSPFDAGRIYIGGGDRGQNPQLSNALSTVVYPGASILANSLQTGNGGKIVVWGNERALMAGQMSAEGGAIHGDGGFLEISSPRDLSFLGDVSTLSPYGKTGLLLLDPTNISIGTVTDVGVVIGTPTTWAVATNPVNIAAITAASNISNALAATNVSIDTTTPPNGGNAGTITVLSPITWNSGFGLTLNAASDISINADIQNQGVGTVTLTSGGKITLDSNVPASRSVVVGSKQGTTTVTATGNIALNGSNAGGLATQIGWKAIANDIITGNIVVNSGGSITLQTGTGSTEGAVIGHGAFYAAVNNITINANVTVTAGTDISLITKTGSAKGALIGYGNITTVGGSYTGAVSVSCGGNYTHDASQVTGASVGSHASTGFGIFVTDIGTSHTGSVTANIGGNFSIIPPKANGAVTLGLGTSGFTPLIDHVSVTVNVGGAISITGPTLNANCRVYIGKLAFLAGATDFTGNVTVNCCGNILLTANSANFCFIGYAPQAGNAGTVNVTVNGGSIDLKTPNAPLISTGSIIGMCDNALTVNTTTGTTTVQSADYININGFGRSGIDAKGNVNVSAQGNITVNGSSASVVIGTELLAGGFTTKILAGGNIVGTGNTLFGTGYLATGAPVNASLDIEAAGDIQPPGGFTTTTGSITLAADHPFAGIKFNNAFCNIAKPAIAADHLGSVIIPAAQNPTFQTTSGNIAFQSAPKQSNGAIANFTIGTAVSNVKLVTTSGNISVLGSICSDGFTTINVQTPVTTSGNISLRAAANLNVNSSVTTTGAAGTIALVSDGDSDGIGNLNINANITAVNGSIGLSAGILDANCNPTFPCNKVPAVLASNINHNAGTVSTTGGTISEIALGDINVNAASGGISSASGVIQLQASNNINIFKTIQNTMAGGGLLFIAGNNINLNSGNLSSPNPVTLVVDAKFPTQPFLGSGALTTAAGTAIIGSVLNIYTSLQSQNMISGLLNGQAFTPGALFANTNQEVWCTYFNCSSPLSALGNPFTIFYKNCLQQATMQAQIIVMEFNVDLHPYNEFPGWMERFWLEYRKSDSNNIVSSINELGNEPYYLRRRHFNIINHPKSWTVLTE